MRFYDCSWRQIERYLAEDDRVVLPLGSVEQHAYLSVGTDAILAERVAVEAAEAAGVLVLPALPFGLTPNFTAYPGTISLRVGIYLEVVRDLLDGLAAQGFRRILIVNGHAGNSPAEALVKEWRGEHPDTQVIFHAFLLDPKVWAVAKTIDPEAGHASWLECFPWTRVAGETVPAGGKPAPDPAALRTAGAARVREIMGDGSGGGPYSMPEQEMTRLWEAAVADVRETIEHGWSRPTAS